MKNVITVRKLVKQYGKLTAVKGVSFEVRRGEIFGLLGENGAGKTTTLEIIEGLRQATSGEVTVLSDNVHNGCSDNIKNKIGVQLQSSAYYNFLTLKEILELFGGFYPKFIPAMALLEMVGLTEKANSLVSNLSGGQRQRFSIVASLVNDPEIVFLDEPTTGLDPVARRRLWDLITNIKNQGKTIILTTHYMEEAEMLCDRIAIMDQGKILALGETHKLIEQTKTPFHINFVLTEPDPEITNKLKVYGKVANLAHKSNHFEVRLKNQANLNKAIRLIDKLDPESLTVGRATLEDLFIELTGHDLGEGNV
ncbi:MAG: ABC transporter ATP-binding protein [Patescibacteria group bacterium]